MSKKYIRKGRKYSVEEIIESIREYKQSRKKPNKIELDGDQINIRSSRLHTFVKTGTTCVCCGLKGSYFVKEKHTNNDTERYHLNLYAAVNGGERMMTSDHIIPYSKQKGLSNNRQTMCFNCNHRKADRMISNEELRKEINKGNLFL